MGKAISQIYKHGQSQLSNMSIKEPVLSYLASQIESSTALTRTPVSSVVDKNELIPFFVPKIPSIII